MSIATTILQQLGGTARLHVMIGARAFVDLGNGVRFAIGRNAKRVNKIEIKLDWSDTYSVRLLNVNVGRREMVQVKSEDSGVYCDQLRGVIERGTGMYLSL